MNILRSLLLAMLLLSQPVLSESFDLNQDLLKNFLASNEDRAMQDIMSNSERKIAKKKLARIVQTIRKNDSGRILGIKQNSQGYAVRVIHNGRIQVLQVDQDGASIIW